MFGSMRFKLTLVFVAVFGGGQVLLWLVVDGVRTDQLLSEVDNQLMSRVQEMLNAIENQASDVDPDRLAETASSRWKPFESPNFFFQLRRSDGELVVQSHTLAKSDLSFTLGPVSSSGGGVTPSVQTLSGPSYETLVGRDGALRSVTAVQTTDKGEAFQLQAAINLQPILRAISESRRLLIVFGVVSLVLAALTTWIVSSHLLAPLRTLTRTVKRVNASRLRMRMPREVTSNGDEVGSAIRAVHEMLDRLEREFHDLERFIANVSHELKTPLAILLGEARNRRRHLNGRSPSDEFLEIVEQESWKLLRIIETLLTLTRAKARGLSVRGEVSIEDAILAAILSCQAPAREKDVRLLPQFDVARFTEEPHVAGDADLLRSMLENLLQNAIRHSPPGETIDVYVTHDQEQVRTTIRDRGPGIPEDQIDRIFHRFHPFDSVNPPGGAAGLGLAIVKAVADLHEGDVSVRNRPDRGCEFTVSLPLLPSNLQAK